MIEIIDKKKCCGCSSCSSVCTKNAISMTPDSEGFLYPMIDDKKCVDCGLCEKVCPILNRDNKKNTELNEQLFFACRIDDKEKLNSSSSGGVFSALASMIIEEKGVVVGATYNDEMEVVHDFAECEEEFNRFRGSKYSQSNLLGIYPRIKELLVSGRKVMFTGTPCQVDGLLRYLRKPYDNLLTVDLVCHAVPSPLILKEYVRFIEKKYKKRIKWISMRDKERKGWGRDFSYRFIFTDDKFVIDPIWIKNWGVLFFSKNIDRPSCHQCKYTNYNRPGDITIADYWDDKNAHPEYRSENGTSLCILNTQKGKEFFLSTKGLSYISISKEESWQPCLEKPTEENENRTKFWQEYYNNGFGFIFKKYLKPTKKQMIKKFIKNSLKLYK